MLLKMSFLLTVNSYMLDMIRVGNLTHQPLWVIIFPVQST